MTTRFTHEDTFYTHLDADYGAPGVVADLQEIGVLLQLQLDGLMEK